MEWIALGHSVPIAVADSIKEVVVRNSQVITFDEEDVGSKWMLVDGWWKMAFAMQVFPIPPGPMRATCLFFSDPIVLSTRAPRPKNSLGGGEYVVLLETLL